MKPIRLFLALAAAACIGLALLAAAAPAIGLGRDQNFIGFVLFDWTRGETAIGAVLAACGLFVLLAVERAIALALWTVSDRGRIWLASRSVLVRWLLETAYPALAMSVVMLAIFVAIAETYFRATIPFLTTRWPSRFDPSVGFILEPGAQVRLTNGVDFWIRGRANSAGLLDREPAGPKKPGTCRILFVGDSFVEAAQVEIKDKVHVVLETLMNGASAKVPVETAATGYSGTGQASQLPLFERFGRPFKPDLVVLVFVSNDFRNNSAVLEAVANGWHPGHPPRMFFTKNPASGAFERVPIDPDWRRFAAPESAEAIGWSGHLDRFLRESSYFYVFLRGHWVAWFPAPTGPAKSDERIRWLLSLPGHADALKGWDFAATPDSESLFFGPDPLPPAFEDALGATRAAFEAYVRWSQEDRFRLLVLGSHSLRDPAGGPAPSRQVERLRAIIDPLGIPYVDQSDYIRSIGHQPVEANYRRDGHWNPDGHRWAAEALRARLAADPTLCMPKP